MNWAVDRLVLSHPYINSLVPGPGRMALVDFEF